VNRRPKKRTFRPPAEKDPAFLRGRRVPQAKLDRARSERPSAATIATFRRALTDAYHKAGHARGKQYDAIRDPERLYYEAREASASSSVHVIAEWLSAHETSVRAREVRSRRRVSPFRELIDRFLSANPDADEPQLFQYLREVEGRIGSPIDEIDLEEQKIYLRKGRAVPFSALKDLIYRSRKSLGISTRATRKRE
jgi:hypothetical protein